MKADRTIELIICPLHTRPHYKRNFGWLGRASLYSAQSVLSRLAGVQSYVPKDPQLSLSRHLSMSNKSWQVALSVDYSQAQSRYYRAAENAVNTSKEEDDQHGVILQWDLFQGRRYEAARGVSRDPPG